jgi:hypothetical protein
MTPNGGGEEWADNITLDSDLDMDLNPPEGVPRIDDPKWRWRGGGQITSSVMVDGVPNGCQTVPSGP